MFNLSCFVINLHSMHFARRCFQVGILIAVSKLLVKLPVNIDKLKDFSIYIRNHVYVTRTVSVLVREATKPT